MSLDNSTYYSFLLINVFFLEPLGSIPELAAESCHEIKESEGGEAVSKKYWFDSIVPDNIVLADCDMETEGTGDAFLTMRIPLTMRVTQRESW